MTKKVLFATPGKAAAFFWTFAAELLINNGHPKAIQHVAIEMSAAYANGVSGHLGDVRVVYEKFHVFQNVVETCNQARKAESRAYAGKRDQLGQARWILPRNGVSCTEEKAQKWEGMGIEGCVTGIVYGAGPVNQGTNEWKDDAVAMQLFGSWRNWSRRCRSGPVGRSNRWPVNSGWSKAL